jgi:hypothetical protein
VVSSSDIFMYMVFDLICPSPPALLRPSSKRLLMPCLVRTGLLCVVVARSSGSGCKLHVFVK